MARRSLLRVEFVATLLIVLLLVGGAVTLIVWLNRRQREADAERQRQWGAPSWLMSTGAAEAEGQSHAAAAEAERKRQSTAAESKRLRQAAAADAERRQAAAAEAERQRQAAAAEAERRQAAAAESKRLRQAAAAEAERLFQAEAERAERRREWQLSRWPKGTTLDSHIAKIPGMPPQVAAQNRKIQSQVQRLNDLLHDGLRNPPQAEPPALYLAGDPKGITEYIELTLTAMQLGTDSPKARVVYLPESRQLVVEYELPADDIVPKAKSYRYVKSQDKVVETSRPASQVNGLYSSAIARLTLLCLARIFQVDTKRHVDVAVFNGVRDAIDRRTGKPTRPCLITVRTTRDAFTDIDLDQVDPVACLKYLHAGISTSPTELAPVRPVLEFSMVDPRFITETDTLGALDDRPNLMELTSQQFESLIQNLFEKIGLRYQADPSFSGRRRRLRRLQHRSHPGRQSSHPGQTLQKHCRCLGSPRPVRHTPERGRIQGHTRHDKPIRQSVLRLRQGQTDRAVRRHKPHVSPPNPCGHQRSDRAARRLARSGTRLGRAVTHGWRRDRQSRMWFPLLRQRDRISLPAPRVRA